MPQMLLERDAEIGTLLALLRDASAGRGRVVVVEGEAGIGKTALLQFFDAKVGERHRIHWGWNDPFTTQRPLGALHDMTAIAGSKVGDLLRCGASPDAIFPAVLDDLMRAPQAVVLVFEDLQWADTATLDLIRFLGRRIAFLKAMIVLTIRRTDLERDHPATYLLGELPAVTRIVMEPLSREAVIALAGDGRDGETLYRTTDGNPFFVTELLADGNHVESHLPVSIRDAVWARWSRLPQPLRAFLDIVSILPGGASARMVPALPGGDAEELALQCVERGLLRWDQMGTLVFRHELARQATLERLSPATQRGLHARMETIFAAMPASDSDPSILAQRLHHTALSGNSAGVLDLAPRAASQAAKLGAHLQAATHLATALAHVALASPPVAARLYEAWAHETFLAGSASSEETMRAYTVAISLWRSQGEIEKVGLNLCRLARLHWRRGETDQAVSYTEQAVRELEARAPSSELALAYSTRSQFLMLQDRFEEAILWGRHAMELSDRLGQIETRIHAMNNVGTSLAFAGREGGDALLEQSLALALEHGFHDHASRAYTNLSESRMLFRDFARADALMTEGIAFCVQHDLDGAAHYLLGHHAQLRLEQGRLHEAKLIAEGVTTKDGAPRVMLLPALCVLARVEMRFGRPEGLELLAHALEEGETTGIFYIAQNVGTSSPRLLHDLQDAVHRGVPIVTINLLRERGLERFKNPQAPTEMLSPTATPISSDYFQVKNGGDTAALFGICKALIEADDRLRLSQTSLVSGNDDVPDDPSEAAAVAFAASVASADRKHVLDHDFIATHTAGFETFANAARAHDWGELERVSGLTREQMVRAAAIYAAAESVLIAFGMGLTQHVMGVENIHMIANLALLRGNIGKPGGNICAVRGHSNVQGQRTVGITEKPGLVPLDKLADLYAFEPPRGMGRSTVDTCEAILNGKARAFIGLGGNFLRAVPETEAVEAAWRKLRLTVQIATKPNRSHVLHGEIAYLLPCLGRIEIDQQESGPQAVSIESSVAQFHGSRGSTRPAAPNLRSEPAIIAGIAKATLARGSVPWDDWVGDYGRVRDAIETTYPETFRDFNARLFQPGGITRPVPARERKWVTSNGKANFITPQRLFPEFDLKAGGEPVLNLATLRSNDQFNTTIYGYSDRFRGVEGTRKVVFMNVVDIARQGLAPGRSVDLVTALDGATERKVEGFRIVAYAIPEGCCAAYFPESNPLFPLSHHDQKAKTPSYKLLPVFIRPSRVQPAD